MNVLCAGRFVAKSEIKFTNYQAVSFGRVKRFLYGEREIHNALKKLEERSDPYIWRESLCHWYTWTGNAVPFRMDSRLSEFETFLEEIVSNTLSTDQIECSQFQHKNRAIISMMMLWKRQASSVGNSCEPWLLPAATPLSTTLHLIFDKYSSACRKFHCPTRVHWRFQARS